MLERSVLYFTVLVYGNIYKIVYKKFNLVNYNTISNPTIAKNTTVVPLTIVFLAMVGFEIVFHLLN